MPRAPRPRAPANICTCTDCSGDRSRARILAFTLAGFLIWAALLFLSLGE